MIRVFLSHQSADATTAAYVARRLKDRHGIDSYLDVIDPYIGRPGEDLAAHIRAQMGRCTQLLAVISESTKASQWVPWEIGVAAEKDHPLATFSAGGTLTPEFLRKWPYLRTDSDLDQYAIASKTARNTFMRNYTVNLSESAAQKSATGQFYSLLRHGLNQ